MTGPDHYAEAEWILNAIRTGETGDIEYPRTEFLAAAQVHATLALAAATALGALVTETRAWAEAAGT